MSVETQQTLWNQWVQIWNGNLALADEIIAPEFVAHFAPVGATPAEVRGPEGIQQWIAGFTAAYSDSSFTVSVGPILDDHQIAGRWLFRGIYRGGIPGAAPSAVGKTVEFAGIDLLRVEDGKLVEYWLCADTLQMLQQLGMIPA